MKTWKQVCNRERLRAYNYARKAHRQYRQGRLAEALDNLLNAYTAFTIAGARRQAEHCHNIRALIYGRLMYR